jgi:hypothetical protein
MFTNLDEIKFRYSKEDRALFDDFQRRYFDNIEKNYIKLKAYCLPEIEVVQSATHKEWIRARINLYVTTSVMRLLYLTETVTEASNNFNAVTVAVHIKAMIEIPFHLAYLVWILSEKHTFEEIREELKKVAWGIPNPDTGLTYRTNVTQREFYEKADLVTKKLFNETPDMLNVFETIYKDANATGHHNYEGRNVLVGVQNDNTWKMRDRKEWFVFLSKNIFQFFLQADTILFMSDVLIKAINHYVDQLPDNFPETDVKATT